MSLFGVLVGLHAVGGSVALLAGPIPMAAAKGGRLHRRAGWLYATAMLITTVTALVLAVAVNNALLLVIAVFSFFLVFTGTRALARRRGQPIGFPDRLVPWAALMFGVALFVRGAVLSDVTNLFFGIGSVILAAREIRALHNPKTQWLLMHITAMLGAYIATFSAFLVVNIGFVSKPLLFILPTLVGTPFIVWTVLRYQRQQAVTCMESV